MNIGIDIDDTITCTYETILPMIAVKYGMNLEKLFSTKPNYAMLRGTLPDYQDFVCSNYPVMAKIVPLKEGVIEVLNKLRSQGHKIILISARNQRDYSNPYDLSYSYLKRMGVPFDKLVVGSKDKAKECILENIDLFIDDNTKNCKAVLKRGIPTLQFDAIFTDNNSKLTRVYSWNEVYNKVQEMMV